MIVAPRLLPDELAAGYWGRVLLLNGIDGSASNRTRQEFTHRLCAERGIEFKGANRGLELISSAAQISATQLLSGHTLVPLHGAVSGVVNSNWFDERYEFRVLRTATAVQDGLKFGALCPQCVEEDRTFWGVAYWRRSHQIPSIPFCDKHSCALRTANARMIVQALPDETKVRPIDDWQRVLIDDAIANEGVRRYADVTFELLNRTRPLSRLQVLHALAKRARLLGICVEDNGIGHSLSDFAVQQLPGSWIDRFVSTEHLNEVLRRFYSSLTATSYALAIALLFKSAEDAFRELEQPLPTVASLASQVHGVVDEWANCRPWTDQQILEMRRRLTAGIEMLVAGNDVQTSAQVATCFPFVFEAAVVRCFAGVVAKNAGAVAGSIAAPPPSGQSFNANPYSAAGVGGLPTEALEQYLEGDQGREPLRSESRRTRVDPHPCPAHDHAL